MLNCLLFNIFIKIAHRHSFSHLLNRHISMKIVPHTNIFFFSLTRLVFFYFRVATLAYFFLFFFYHNPHTLSIHPNSFIPNYPYSTLIFTQYSPILSSLLTYSYSLITSLLILFYKYIYIPDNTHTNHVTKRKHAFV